MACIVPEREGELLPRACFPASSVCMDARPVDAVCFVGRRGG